MISESEQEVPECPPVPLIERNPLLFWKCSPDICGYHVVVALSAASADVIPCLSQYDRC
jgi:hypothetical protein